MGEKTYVVAWGLGEACAEELGQQRFPKEDSRRREAPTKRMSVWQAGGRLETVRPRADLQHIEPYLMTIWCRVRILNHENQLFQLRPVETVPRREN